MRPAMEEYERRFILRMKEATDERISFRSAVWHTLREILGESPSEVLEMQLSGEALTDPRQFVAEVSSIFGSGAQAICFSIERYVEETVRAREEGEEAAPAYLAIKQRLEQRFKATGTETERSRAHVPLHDHRILDETGSYASDADPVR